MQPDDRTPIEVHVRGKISGKKAKNREPDEEKGGNEPDDKTGSTQTFQKQLQEGGFDHHRQAQAPYKFHTRYAENVLFEVFVDHA